MYIYLLNIPFFSAASVRVVVVVKTKKERAAPAPVIWTLKRNSPAMERAEYLHKLVRFSLSLSPRPGGISRERSEIRPWL